MKKVIYVFALALSPTLSYASEECVEVIGIDESDPGATAPPMTVGGILGGGLVGSGGTSTPKTGGSVAKKTAEKAKDIKNEKKDEKKSDEKDWFDWLLGLFRPQVTAVKQAIDVVKSFNISSTDKENRKIIRRSADGTVVEEEHISKCKSTQINDKREDPCTKLEVKPFVDPEEPNVRKYILSITPVAGIYDPVRDGADAEGYFERVYGQYTLEFVFRDLQDLEAKLLSLDTL